MKGDRVLKPGQWTIRHRVQYFDEALEDWVPIEGLPVQAYFAAEEGGAALGGRTYDLSDALVGGTYIYPVPPSHVQDIIDAYAGQYVYRYVRAGANGEEQSVVKLYVVKTNFLP